jgi:hypothetical protein
MIFFFTVLFILCISVQVSENITSKQVVGKWNCTVVTETGHMNGVLKFVEKEGKLIGEVIPDEGDVFPMTKVEIKEGDVLYFELVFEYELLKITLKVDGEKFKGSGYSYDVELFGKRSWE